MRNTCTKPHLRAFANHKSTCSKEKRKPCRKDGEDGIARGLELNYGNMEEVSCRLSEKESERLFEELTAGGPAGRQVSG